MAAAHRRLADLAAVHVRNAQAPTASSTSDTPPVSACFVTLRRPNEIPFYITPPAPTAQASWGEYTSPPIWPATDFAPSAWSHMPELLVGLYVRTDLRWSCVWETLVDLRTLPSLGTELSSVREFQPNLVYLALRQNHEDTQLEYVAIHSDAPHEPDAEEAGRRAMLLSMVETHMQQSCTLPQALSVVHVQGDLRALHNTLDTLQRRCGHALTDNGLAEKVRLFRTDAAPSARISATPQGPAPPRPAAERAGVPGYVSNLIQHAPRSSKHARHYRLAVTTWNAALPCFMTSSSAVYKHTRRPPRPCTS